MRALLPTSTHFATHTNRSMSLFIDSHCHLNRLKLKEDETLSDALAHARAAGVGRFLAIMCDLSEYDDIRAIVQAEADVGMSVGVHPCEDPQAMAQATVETLCTLADDSKVWAIGETGLDYYYSKDHSETQKASFARHIHASQQIKKPLVVHSRDAKRDTIEVLSAENADHGIIHCFTEDWDMAKQALDLGFYISFSGIVSFKNAHQLHDVARKVPLDKMLIETDSPYLAPTPHRGKPNEPKLVPFVAEAIAKLRGISAQDIGEATSRNFITLLNQEREQITNPI